MSKANCHDGRRDVQLGCNNDDARRRSPASAISRQPVLQLACRSPDGLLIAETRSVLATATQVQRDLRRILIVYGGRPCEPGDSRSSCARLQEQSLRRLRLEPSPTASPSIAREGPWRQRSFLSGALEADDDAYGIAEHRQHGYSSRSRYASGLFRTRTRARCLFHGSRPFAQLTEVERNLSESRRAFADCRQRRRSSLFQSVSTTRARS